MEKTEFKAQLWSDHNNKNKTVYGYVAYNEKGHPLCVNIGTDKQLVFKMSDILSAVKASEKLGVK